MNTIKYMWVAFIAVILAGFASCTDDNGDAYPGGNDPVTVNNVYLENVNDTVNTDRLVTFARLGQTLRFEGTGFGGLKQIFVNGYNTYFNTATATNNMLILALDSKTPISEAADSVRNTIQFVKRDGTIYTFEFDVRAASPQITNVSSTLPAAGETVIVTGSNLQETTEITLPGGIKVTDITNAPTEEDGEWFSFVMPSGVTESGRITTVGANGSAQSAAYFNDSKGMLLNFDGVGVQGEWGWTETGSMIGAADLVQDPLNSGRGLVCPILPTRLATTGAAAGNNHVSEVWTAGAGGPTDDWKAITPDIPLTTPVEDVAFQFDIYVPDAWTNSGYIQVNIQNNSSWTGYGSGESSSIGVAYVIPWLQDGVIVPFQTSGWQTITVPFSQFGVFATAIADDETPTWGDVIDYRAGATYMNFGMGFVNGDLTVGSTTYPAAVSNQMVYVDNLRIVPCETSVVPDF